jgi:hypothetical protein
MFFYINTNNKNPSLSIFVFLQNLRVTGKGRKRRVLGWEEEQVRDGNNNNRATVSGRDYAF